MKSLIKRGKHLAPFSVGFFHWSQVTETKQTFLSVLRGLDRLQELLLTHNGS
jgi:hypothetical protein